MHVRTIFSVALAAAVAGAALGALWGYVEARPWTWRPTKVETSSTPGVAAVPEKPDPVLIVDEPIYQFDAMEVGTTLDHLFRLTNQGDLPVSVTFASITCQCTGLELAGQKVEPGASRTIAPGGSLDARLEWEAKAPPRPFRHGATLTSTDPAQARIELTVEGEVVASSTLDPPRFVFGGVQVGETETARVNVLSRVNQAVEVLSYEVEGPELAESVSIEIEPLDQATLAEKQARSGVAIVATLGPQKSLGPLTGRLRVRTNLEKSGDLSIPISGNVTGDISVYGPGWLPRTGLLKLGSIDSKKGKQVRLIVAVRGKHATDTSIKVASIDPEQLQATVGEPRRLSDDQVHIPLVIEAPVGMKPMVRMATPTNESLEIDSESFSRGEGSLVLSTTHPETPEVRLRISLTVVP